MAAKARQQYYADGEYIDKQAREFQPTMEFKTKIDSIEPGAQVNIIEDIKVNGTSLEVDDKTVDISIPLVIDNLYSTDGVNALSAKQGKVLYDLVQNLESRGRYLSNWNTATGLPTTNPVESHYQYRAGDYYVVSNVAAQGGTNYRPEPGEFVIGQASITVETEVVKVTDMYLYDGSNWNLLINSTREIAIDSSLSTSSTNPVENRVVTNAINGKQDTLVAGSNIQIASDGKTISATDTTYTAGTNVSIDANNQISAVDTTYTAGANVQISNQNVISATDTTYAEGTGIDITNNIISNEGVLTVNGGNGNVLVNDVKVSSTAPANPTEGVVWYDTTNDILKMYDGTQWNATGKTYTAGFGIDIDTNNNNEISVDTADLDGFGLSVNGGTGVLDVDINSLIDTTNGHLDIDPSTSKVSVDMSDLTSDLAGFGLSQDILGSSYNLKVDTYSIAGEYLSQNAIDSKLDVDTYTLTSDIAGFGLGTDYNSSTGKYLLKVDVDDFDGFGLTTDSSGANTVLKVDTYDLAGNYLSQNYSNSKLDVDRTSLVSDIAGFGLSADSSGTGYTLKVNAYDLAGTGLEYNSSNNNIDVDYDTVGQTLAGTGLDYNSSTGAIDIDTTVVATQTDLSGKQDKATSGSTAPSTTPSYVGQQYIDTTNDKMYVATGTSSSSDWTEVGAGSGDMLYSDFNWVTKTGATITLDLRSEITPSTDFTVNKPSTLEDGQYYILRVTSGATAYTMTLGTNVTNPYSEDLTLEASTIQQFTFLAKGGNLELQPSSEGTVYTAGTGITISNDEISADTTVLATKTDLSDLNTKTFYLSSTSDLTTATNALQWHFSGKNAIIVYSGNAYTIGTSSSSSPLVFVSTIARSPSSSLTKNWIKNLQIFFDSSHNATVIHDSTKLNEQGFIETDYNYSTPYTPTYAGSPATKKYVDDNVVQKSATAPSSPTEGMVWYDTTNDVLKVYDGTDWNEVGSGGAGDMLYQDFNWVTKTGATVTLDFNSIIEPSANFTVNAPSTIKDGQVYILRVESGATAYTMTLGTGITNPYSVSTSLTANKIKLFTFLAIDGNLELQPSISPVDISGKQDKATSGTSAPATTPSYIGQEYIKTNDKKLYIATGTTSSTDWTLVGGDIQLAPNSPLTPKYLWYGTQAQYEALSQYYTDEANDTVYFTI